MADLTRSALSAELLSYPPLRAEKPCEYLHCARLVDPRDFSNELRKVRIFCERIGCPPPDTSSTFFEGKTEHLHFQWELHSEYASVIVATRPNAPKSALDNLILEYRDQFAEHVISAAHIRVVSGVESNEERDQTVLEALGKKTCGGTVCDSHASIWSTFQINRRGLTPYVVIDQGMTVGRMSRLIRRLAELDTYRMLAIRGLPVAKVLLEDIEEVEERLTSIVTDMRAAVSSENTNSLLLDRLMKLSARLAARRSETASLFGACRSYRGIVEQRIKSLNEQRIQGFQRCSVFLNERLVPAMRTCDIAAERLDTISSHILSALALVRTRIDVRVQEQNRAQLEAVNKQIRQQIQLQTSVERLSVIAISYYAAALIALLAKAAADQEIIQRPSVWVALSIPLVIALAYTAIKKGMPKKEDN